MNTMAVTGNGDYYAMGTLTQMRAWAKKMLATENCGGCVEIYRMNRDGSMGEHYEFVEE